MSVGIPTDNPPPTIPLKILDKYRWETFRAKMIRSPLSCNGYVYDFAMKTKICS